MEQVRNFYPTGFGGGITNEKTITEQGKYAMDAYQANSSKEGTMAHDIKQLQDALKDIMKWKFVGIFDLEANVEKHIDIPDTANEVWLIVGNKSQIQIFGGISCTLPHLHNSQNIVFVEDVYKANGVQVAKGMYAVYVDNVLRVKIVEILASTPIAARVYYR